MPQLRKDPITGRWVIIATDRVRRPSDFIRVPVVPTSGKVCPFCPGNEQKTPPEVLAYRPEGGPNASGWTLRVVPCKFPVLRVEGDLERQGEGVYDMMEGVGAHEIIIETPEHLHTLGDLEEKNLADVFWAFRERILDLKRDRRLIYILIFKNHGEAAGASLEHSHSELIALPVIPKRANEEIAGAKRYFDYKDRCIYCDIIRQELETGTRVVLETEQFVAVSPYAARFPFETWILPRRHDSHFENIDSAAARNLAWMQGALTRKIEKVLELPAYNLMIHSAPVQEAAMPHYHWHIEIIPKLKKMAGFEWGTGFYINPTPPEEAARFLREAGVV